MMHDFPYSFTEVLEINYLSPVPQGRISDTDCPFCHSRKKLNINNKAGKCVARCNKCNWSGGLLKFHADLNGINSLKDAKKDIESKLNLDIHSDNYKERSSVVRQQAAIVEEETIQMPLDERDMKYRKMASYLTLDDDHMADLIKRGLSKSFVEARGYRSLPVDVDARYRLARRIMQDGVSVKGLPGFYMDTHGDYVLKKYARSLMIPVLSLNGRIEGYQIRKDNDKVQYKPHKDCRTGKLIVDDNGNPILFPTNKFNSLSSPNEKYGGSMKSVCHFAGARIWDEKRQDLVPIIKKKSIKVTEGPLKADIFYHLTGEPMVAILGVNNVKQLEKMLTDIKILYPDIDTLEDCLDMDYISNENVKKAIENIQEMADRIGLKYVRKTWNPEYKGVDDFALAWKKGIYKKQ